MQFNLRRGWCRTRIEQFDFFRLFFYLVSPSTWSRQPFDSFSGMLSLESGDPSPSSSSSPGGGGEIQLEEENSSSSSQLQQQPSKLLLPSSPPSSLPSLMSLIVPPPPIATASTGIAAGNLPIALSGGGNGSPSQQLHILVISQPPGLNDSISGHQNSFQSLQLFPGTH